MSETAPPHYLEFNHPNWMLPTEDIQKAYFEHHPHSDILWYPERFVPAKLDDYAVWFRGHLQQGGQVSTIWTQEFAEEKLGRALTATESFRLDGEFAFSSRMIFALPGVQVGGNSGFSRIYMLEDCQQVTCRADKVEPAGTITAPLITAPEFGTIPGVEALFFRLMSEAVNEAASDVFRNETTTVINQYLRYAGDLGVSVAGAEVAYMINPPRVGRQ